MLENHATKWLSAWSLLIFLAPHQVRFFRISRFILDGMSRVRGKPCSFWWCKCYSAIWSDSGEHSENVFHQNSCTLSRYPRLTCSRDLDQYGPDVLAISLRMSFSFVHNFWSFLITWVIEISGEKQQILSYIKIRKKLLHCKIAWLQCNLTLVMLNKLWCHTHF